MNSSNEKAPASANIPDAYGAVLRTAALEVASALGSRSAAEAVEAGALGENDGPLTAAAVVGALAACGLQAERLAPGRIARWVGPGRVAIAVADDEIALVSNRTRRHLDCTVIDPLDVTRSRIRGARADRALVSRGEWVAVTFGQGLDEMTSAAGVDGPWKRLAALARIEKRDISVVAAYAATLGVLTLVIPVATQSLVNTIAFGAVLQPLVVLTVALLVGLGLAGCLAALQAYVVEVLQRRVLVRFAEDLAQRLPRVQARARDGQDLVELNNRFLDVITVQKTSAELLLVGLGLALQTIVGFILLGFYHPALLAFAIVLLMGLAAVILLGRGGTRTAIYESKAKFRIAGWLDELARNPALFSAGHGSTFAAERSADRIHDYVRCRRAHYRHVLAVLVGGITLQVLSLVALLAVGGYLVIDRQLTLGQLIAAEIVVGAIAMGMGKLGRLADKAFDLVAATDKLGRLLGLPLREDGGDPLPSGQPGMCLSADSLVIEGAGVQVGPLSFDIKALGRYQLDAASDLHSSLLLETLAGHRPTAAGTVAWESRRRPRLDELSRAALLLRRDSLFGGSVFDNLRLADAGLGDERAWQALEAVGLDAVIGERGGLGVHVLPNGSPLSASQQSRLLLARAIIAKPRLLLIDGILDRVADDKELIGQFLGDDAPWTSVVASHDPRLRPWARRVIDIVGTAGTDEESAP